MTELNLPVYEHDWKNCVCTRCILRRYSKKGRLVNPSAEPDLYRLEVLLRTKTGFGAPSYAAERSPEEAVEKWWPFAIRRAAEEGAEILDVFVTRWRPMYELTVQEAPARETEEA